MPTPTHDHMIKIVSILNDGNYHLPQTVTKRLNITYDELWQAINKLNNYGIKIDSINNQGIILLNPLILLNEAIIKSGITDAVTELAAVPAIKLKDPNCHPERSEESTWHAVFTRSFASLRKTAGITVELELLECVDSTNDYLKQVTNNNNIKICIAECQTKGKGRFDRVWHSPFGQNLYLSLLMPFEKSHIALQGLSLVVSLAVTKTLAHYQLPDKICIKWPNDIIYQDKKIAGILIEIKNATVDRQHVIIGIGLNVNIDYASEISQPWTSLKKVTVTDIDRNHLCILLIQHLLAYLKLFKENGFSFFIQQWQEADYLYHKTITVVERNEKFEGKAIGIDASGHLILHLESGGIKTFSTGLTSIVK